MIPGDDTRADAGERDPVGGLYGLFSSGLTLIFGITRVINFAHGDFVTLGMYGAVLLFASLGLSPLIGIIPVAILSF
ncbi:hypothetical protein ACFQV8_16460 [Pseudonocardia benzenivorans]